MKKIAVLMSTYNGEKYIEQQIKSILAQEDVDVTLYIRDDGSFDNTVYCIKKFQDKNINIIIGDNKGPCNSFLELVNLVDDTYDYYAFSDQDDIWLPQKIKNSIDLIEKINVSEESCLYYSNQTFVNEDFVEMDITKKNRRRYSFKFSLIRSNFPGCTMLFNKKTMLIMKQYKAKNQIMHDQYVFQIVSGCGGTIIYDSNSYIKYRLHGTNVSNYSSSMVKRIKKLVKDYKEPQKRSDALIELYSNYGTLMTAENKKILKEYAFYKYKNLFKRAWLGLMIDDSIKYKVLASISMILKKF